MPALVVQLQIDRVNGAVDHRCLDITVVRPEFLLTFHGVHDHDDTGDQYQDRRGHENFHPLQHHSLLDSILLIVAGCLTWHCRCLYLIPNIFA